MKKKFTKKEIDAIEKLIYDLDELDNKPSRLFCSLINFADVFLPEKTSNELEHKNKVIESIEEFQDIYYEDFKLSDILERSYDYFKILKRQLSSRNNKMIKTIREEAANEEDANRKDWIYREGVEDALFEYYSVISDYIKDRLKF